jgi:hypothetical protein
MAKTTGRGWTEDKAEAAAPVERAIPVPFTSKAHDDRTADLSGCVLCGRSTPSPRFFVEIADGGKIVKPGSADKEDAGYMGMYPIGSECKNALPSDYIVKG